MSRFLEGVMVSVGRAHLLSRVLSNVCRFVDHLIVVTGNSDEETFELCEKHGVDVVRSDDYKRYGDSFNKGRMLNRGLERLERFEWVVFLDDDVLFPDDMISLVKNSCVLEKCFLYYNWRKQLKGWESGEGREEEVDCEKIFSDDTGPWGFFQLFWLEEACKRIGRNPGELLPTCFPSAGGVDSWFAHRWKESYWQKLPCSPVVHLWHGGKGEGWNTKEGKDSLRGRWKWCGSSCWSSKYSESKIISVLPKPCLFRKLDILSLESETVLLGARGSVVRWKRLNRSGYPFYEWHWKELDW